MKTKLLSVLLLCWVATAGRAYAQTLDQEMSGLADKIGKELIAKGCKNVAAVDFTDIEMQPNELGRFLSEQLTVEIASSVPMVDRSTIKHILTEHNLTVEGLVDPTNAQKLGEFTGADTILTGIITEVDAGYRLDVKVVSTSSTAIVASGWITFKKLPYLEDLENRDVSETGNLNLGHGAATGDISKANHGMVRPLASKDAGNLHIILKSVLPIKIGDEFGRIVNGIRCTFELANRDPQKPLVIAINAERQPPNQTLTIIDTTGQHEYLIHPDTTILRSSLLDDRGGEWDLLSSDLYGIGFVQAGVHSSSNGIVQYNPSEIIRLLRLKDELGRDMDDPSDRSEPYYVDRGHSHDTFLPSPSENKFIAGSTTMINPGETATVTMNFHQKWTQTALETPTSLQFSAEIVVGVVEMDTKGFEMLDSKGHKLAVPENGTKTYSLQNLVLDHIPITAP